MSIEDEIIKLIDQSMDDYYALNKGINELANEILSLPAEGWVVRIDNKKYDFIPQYDIRPATIRDVIEGKAKFLGMEEGE